MNRYRSGPLPKPFKILPALPAWARLMAITDPKMWTPHAFNAATKILISSLKPEQARVYLEAVLLPSVRENMQANQGKLNVQLYDAVRKSTYKPAAFFKGIIFPLVEVSGQNVPQRTKLKNMLPLIARMVAPSKRRPSSHLFSRRPAYPSFTLQLPS